MAIFSLKPSKSGNYTDWATLVGTRPTLVQKPDDDDTSYIQQFDAAARDSYDMDDLPSGVTAVTTHTVSNRTRKSAGAGAGCINNFIRTAGADTDGAITAVTGSYANYTDVDLATLTPAEINASEVGVWCTTMAGDTLRCTTISWDVTAIVGEGLIWGVIGGLLGASILGPLTAGLLRRDLDGMARLAAWKGTRLTRDELDRLWRELWERRWPRLFFLSPTWSS